jgi:drug/metabolite transporter (DMT)-like permease
MIGQDLAAVVFSLASALSWGAGDFSGGLATKRAPVFTVLAIGHAVGLVLLIALALLWVEPIPASADLVWGLVAGMAGAVGVAALYRALAVGRMGLVAPVSGVITAALPALFSAMTEGLPRVSTLIGFGLALFGVWLVAGAGGAEGRRDGLGLALLAGVGFGAFFILVHRAGTSAVFWPLAAARCGSLALVVPIALGRQGVSRNFLPGAQDRTIAIGPALATPGSRFSFGIERRQLVPVLLAGVFDVGGNAFFVLAAQAGRLDVAAVLSSLYPASTVLLAALLLGERITRVQAAGIAAALAAIALIAS